MNVPSVSDDFELRGYFARSSIASFSAPGMSLHGVELHLDSPFQRRQVEADISSSFLTYEGITDSILIIDLIDERFDLAETGASIITLSRELENSGFLKENNFKKIQAHSEKRKELWRAGLKNFAAAAAKFLSCLLYTSPSPRDATLSRMPSSA